ncbi:MAG TPA: hypothetical protein VNE16_09525 [Vicinamibacterales bacterium]|nr:hypothetical protein [Vicinamibacterales bacterium]
MPSPILPRILFLFGIGFLLANARILIDYWYYRRRRRAAILTWPDTRTGYSRLTAAIAVALGLLLVYNLGIERRPSIQVFGEAMMFLYYACLAPLGRRIGRGFYEDGIWAESGFIPYWQIGGISWREGEQVTLIVISRLRNLARRLIVPGPHYAEARRVLRDRIQAHDIQFAGTSLDLGSHDEREDV